MLPSSHYDLDAHGGVASADTCRRPFMQSTSVRRALELLAEHPLLGRPAEDGRRERVPSRGRYGHVAKYRWLPAEQIVLVLAIRHRREAGYSDE